MTGKRLRILYVASIVLGVAAIGSEAAAKRSAAQAAGHMAQRAQAKAENAPEAELVRLRDVSPTSSQQAGTLSVVGTCLAVGAAMCVWRSVATEKPKLVSVPATILIAYAMFALLMV